MPAARPVAIEQLMSGTADSQRVEISGIIRAFRLRESITIFELVSGGYGLDVRVPQFAEATLQPLIGAAVWVRGTAATFSNGQFLPVLQDAVYHRTDEPASKFTPKTVTETELQAGLHHADFVTLRGKLLDRSMTWRQDRVGMPAYLRTVLMLQGADLLFSAESDTDVREHAALAQVPLGSTVEVSGVRVLGGDRGGKLTSLQILQPHGKYFHVLDRPSWGDAPAFIGRFGDALRRAAGGRGLDGGDLPEEFGPESFGGRNTGSAG